MNFLRRAASLFKNRNTGMTEGETAINFFKSLIKNQAVVALFFPILIVLFLSIVLIISALSNFGYDIEMMMMVDPSTNGISHVGVNLDYDFEEYYKLSQSAVKTNNGPSADLASTEFTNREGFNQHIKDSVCTAGFGTREGVVAAGMSLIGDYIKATGKRLRYNQLAGYCSYGMPGRQIEDTDGMISEDFYLDCSGFSWWALYNGGFKRPSWPQTRDIYNWAVGYGDTVKTDISSGQPGDFLDKASSHIVLIVGKYDGGYYVVEEAGCETGAIVNKRDFSSIKSTGYVLLDMTKYYNDSNSLRTDSYCT